MPAKSKAQQKFMGMVHAAQKGEKAASAKVAKVAKRMKKKDAEDYASTKHKGLPTKVKKEDLIRLISKYGARRVKETIMAVRPKSVTVSGSGLNRKPEEPDFEYDPEDVDEGFGGELKGKDKKEFEKARKENAEVLGYEATGTSDTKKQTLKMAHQLKEARSTNREWNKFEKAFGDFFKTVLRLGKANTKLTGNKTDEKIFIKNFNRDVGKFYSLMQSWIRGQNESVNEADLGLTYKKGKTVKVKHKSSGKRLVIVDKPAVRKEYEKIGYFAESVNEAKFTSDQIELLKMSWNTLKGINPSSPTYKKFIKFLDKLPKDELKQLANAKIKFVSILAKNRIKGESVNEELYNSQGEQTDFKKGDVVKDINPDCPHVGSEGEVTKVTKDEVTYTVRNNGRTYKVGDELTKTKDQLIPLSVECVNEAAKRDYKDEYKKFQSSDKSKKYRAELNQYNRKKGTYGNKDGKDASHKGGKIAGFEKESTNRGRREKSRLKGEVSNPAAGIMMAGRIGTGHKFSSPEAKTHVNKDVTTMSKFLGKASQQVIKTMMDGVKGGKYNAMDLARGIQVGPANRTHFGETDFIQQLWNKVRDKFRKYSKGGKLT